MKISIIGGYGRMGKIFARLFSEGGHDVLITGPEEVEGTKLANELKVGYERDNIKAVVRADIVIVSVPIERTVDVIREVAPHMKRGSLLADLTSVKVIPCKEMEENAMKGVEVLGCHPLFGPNDDPNGQNVAFCPVRGGRLSDWFKDYFSGKGFVVSELSADNHDRAMAVVQELLHSVTISYAEVVSNLKVGSLDKLLTPKARAVLSVGNAYREQGKMVEGIRKLNQYSDEAMRAFRERLDKFSGT